MSLLYCHFVFERKLIFLPVGSVQPSLDDSRSDDLFSDWAVLWNPLGHFQKSQCPGPTPEAVIQHGFSIGFSLVFDNFKSSPEGIYYAAKFENCRVIRHRLRWASCLKERP